MKISFKSIRSDWYASNQLLPRVAKNALGSDVKPVFTGFPKQWIPLFIYLELPWESTTQPKEHIPLYSDLTEKQLEKICDEAARTQTLRNLVESACVLDPVLTDFLYIVDNSRHDRSRRSQVEQRILNASKPIKITSWLSFGRPEVLELDRKSSQVFANGRKEAVVLPCSRKRPYESSRTHKRIYKILEQSGLDLSSVHRIVVSSIGVIPEELWREEAVLLYDSGMPDIYRLLRLCRSYFDLNRYQTVYNCLQFRPYTDVLNILENEGKIRDIQQINLPRSRQFYVR